MKKNEKLNEWIIRYNEGTLTGEERLLFLEMLRDSPEVRSETELDRELSEFLADRDLVDFHRFLDETLKKRSRKPGMSCFLIAAVLLLLIMIGGTVLFRHCFHRSVPLPLAGLSAGNPRCLTTDKTFSGPCFPRKPRDFSEWAWKARSIDQHLIAESHLPELHLEEMVGISMRHAGFAMISPPYSFQARRGDTIWFRWKCQEGEPLALELVNINGTCVTQVDEMAGTTSAIATNQLIPGLYYWKFLANGNILTVGKLEIR